MKDKQNCELSHDDIHTIIKLIHNFLQLADQLLENRVIAKEQYDQITRNKVQFLKDLEKGA